MPTPRSSGWHVFLAGSLFVTSLGLMSPAVAEETAAPSLEDAALSTIEGEILETTTDGMEIYYSEGSVIVADPEANIEETQVFATELEIALDDPTLENVEVVVGELSEIGDDLVSTTTTGAEFVPASYVLSPAAVAGPSAGYNLKCSMPNYQFSDSNGTFNIRNNCRYSVVNWSYFLSLGLKRIVVSNLNEAGMSWYKMNMSIPMPRNSPHRNVPENYVFHGTLNPAYNGQRIKYNDTITFRTKIGNSYGNGTLTISGYNVGLVG